MFADSEFSFCDFNAPFLNAKRPKLLKHQFNLARQNILLLSTKGSSTSAILAAQEFKIKEFSNFLESLESSIDCWNEAVFDGLEMLLRAVRTIKSTSQHNLLTKMYKFKLKLLLKREMSDSIAIEECFNECISISSSKSIDSFEQYYGIHPRLDSLIGAKILEISYTLSVKEKIILCFDFQRKGDRDNILNDLLKNILQDVKSNPSHFTCEMMCTLMDVLVHLFRDNVNTFAENVMIIYQSNRQKFLENSQIFDKFIESLRLTGFKESPSVVTMFNSRIRSFLSRPEAKNDNIIQNCTKFVLEYYALDIGCIGQFADFLLKCPMMKLEDVCSLTRKYLYKLLRIYLKKTSTRLTDSKFTEFITETLKYEFVLDMLEHSDSSPDFVLLTIYQEYLDQKYIFLLETFLKKYTGRVLESEDEDDFILCFDDQETSEKPSGIPNIDSRFIDFLNEHLLQVYTKRFKMNINEANDMKFIKVVAVITGLLMNSGKVKWAELSGTFGPNAATVMSSPSSRSAYCVLYTVWLKMDHENLISGTMRNTLRGVLNPQNCPELWTKILLDFREYGQVEFFNEYYNLFLTDRIECFKVLGVPAKFIMEIIFKTIDFKSHQIPNTWWSFLIKIANFLIEKSPELHLQGPLCAKFEKYFPTDDFNLIVKFYETSRIGIGLDDFKRHKKDDLFVQHVINLNVNYKSDTFLAVRRIINVLKQQNLSLNVLLTFIYEFLNCHLNEFDKNVFIIQLACASIMKKQPISVRSLFTQEMRRIDYKRCCWTDIYRKLLVLTEISLFPENLNELIKFLCKICGLDHFPDLVEFNENVSDDELGELAANILNFDFKNITILSADITPFNCFTQLLFLFVKKTSTNFIIQEYVEYVRMERGYSDDYFNLKFIK